MEWKNTAKPNKNNSSSGLESLIPYLRFRNCHSLPLLLHCSLMTRITHHISRITYQEYQPSSLPPPTILRKLKRFASIGFIFIFPLYTSYFILNRSPLHAQEQPTPTPVLSNFDTDKIDYLRTYDRYRLDHINYVAAKSTYLQYKTQITKTQALQATQRMLNSRTDVLLKYLQALKSRALASPGLTESELETIIIDLDIKIEWLIERAELFNDADDLDDLVKLSKEIEKEHKGIERISYQTLGRVLIAKDRVFRQSATDLHKLVSDQVVRARTEGYKDTAVMERWLLDTVDKLELSQIKESEALLELSDIKDRDKSSSKQKKFVTFQLLVDEVNQYLKETTQLMLEIIKEMKHA